MLERKGLLCMQKGDLYQPTKQLLYCLKCASEEDSPHDHRPVAIEVEIQAYDTIWTKLADTVSKTYLTSRVCFTPFESVVRYLEKANVVKSQVLFILRDFDELEVLVQDVK